MIISKPISFAPLFMERVWGGRRLETVLGKLLPPGDAPFGEAWEIVDREEAQSVVTSGDLAGKTLHELWTEFHRPVFGAGKNGALRFPLLFKVLDAEERLSVQVHPPAAIAPSLDGEPKTEMWFILDCRADSDLFAGLKRGVTREAFEQALRTGKVEECVHRAPVRPGDAIFIPSGRIHAIGAGNLIVEVQQNSDTTYRVFDWNRMGTDGKPRALHIDESMKSIDFADFEPALAQQRGETVVECEYFRVERWTLDAARPASAPGSFAIFTVLDGAVECGGDTFVKGGFFLVPASMSAAEVKPLNGQASVLRTTIPD
jgi:mannose-6-phosphate isomerase